MTSRPFVDEHFACARIAAPGLLIAILAVACDHRWDDAGEPRNVDVTSTSSSSMASVAQTTTTTSTTSATTGAGGAGGDSGAGGGLVASCGPDGTDTLKDTFSSNVLDEQVWASAAYSGAFLVTSGGALILRPPQVAQDAQSLVGIWSKARYNLIDCQVTVKAVAMPSADSEAYTTFGVEQSVGNTVEIVEWAGTLIAKSFVDNIETTVASVPYDPVAHAYWRLREEAGVTYWETSPDGAAWTVLTSQADPIPLSATTVKLLAGTYRVEPNPIGDIRYDDVNVLP